MYHSWKTLPFLVGLLLSSCAGDETTPPPVPGLGGRVVGRVHGGETGIPMRIQLYSTRPTPSGVSGHYEGITDPRGVFGVTVPAGTFVLRIQPAGEEGWCGSASWALGALTWDPHEADTLRVEEDAIAESLDIALGRVRVTLRMPAEAEGVSYALELNRPTYYWEDCDRIGTVTTVVQNGALEAGFRTLPPGGYHLELRPQHDYDARMWLPGVAAESAADVIRVEPDLETPYTCEIHAPAQVSGRVVGAALELGTGGGTVGLMVSRERGFSVSPNEPDGGFLTSIPFPAAVKVVVGGVVPRWLGGIDEATATVFPLASGVVTDVGEIATNALVVELEGLGKEGLGSIHAELPMDGGVRSAWFHQGPEANTGVLFGVPPGAYRLRLVPSYAYSDPWLPIWFPATSDSAQATPIDVVEGTVTRVHMQLIRGGEIHGDVQNRRGRPSQSAHVYLTAADTTAMTARMPTGMGPFALGAFTFPGLPDGAYKVGAAEESVHWSDDPWFPDDIVWWPGTADWDSAGVIRIVDHNVVAGVELVTR